MKVAWVTPPITEVGGAELGDADMVAARPAGIDIVRLDPFSDMNGLEECDRVVCTRLHNSPPQGNVERLLQMDPVIRSWGIETRVVGLHMLFSGARAYIAASDLHWKCDSEWVECSRVLISPGYRNLDLIDSFKDRGMKLNRVLWAHRDVWHKGLDLAVEWCSKNDRLLMVVKGRPYEEVLLSMSLSSHFILLSKIVDAAPFSVIEAQLLGCEIIKNSLVGGWFDGSIRDRVERAPAEFWDLVLHDRLPVSK